MSNDKINRLKELYFAGKTSREEEKWLKENTKDPFFDVLKEEQKQEMNWGFDEFLDTVEQEKPVKRIGGYNFRKMVYWAAASVALVVFGTLFVMRGNSIDKPQYAKHEDGSEFQIHPKEEINDTQPEETGEEITELPIKEVVKPVSKQKEKTPIPQEDTYHPEYVVINGKPIYDLEEAKELTLSSLNLFASNMEKSVSEMENVKHLSIKF